MRLKSIASHLRPYVMLARRRTTINHAFAAAVAPSDEFNEVRLRAAITTLGCDADSDLPCAYCGRPAETWDHVSATVRNSRFSGHGHRIGNLLPCCKSCNSQKGNKAWQDHLSSLPMGREESDLRRAAITAYLDAYATVEEPVSRSPDHDRLDEIRQNVLALLHEGDQIAARIRAHPGSLA